MDMAEITTQQLQRVHRAAHAEWQRAGRELGLSHSEFEYLSAVQEQEDRLRYTDEHGQHLHDIVEALGVTKASASTMIAKLEQQGLVLRFRCTMDARAHHFILTEQGRARKALGQQVYERVQAKLRAQLQENTPERIEK